MQSFLYYTFISSAYVLLLVLTAYTIEMLSGIWVAILLIIETLSLIILVFIFPCTCELGKKATYSAIVRASLSKSFPFSSYSILRISLYNDFLFIGTLLFSKELNYRDIEQVYREKTLFLKQPRLTLVFQGNKVRIVSSEKKIKEIEKIVEGIIFSSKEENIINPT